MMPLILQRCLSAFVVVSILLCSPPTWAQDRNPDAGARRPNIILITTNVLRYNHLVPYGYKRNTTPTINALAGEAFIFDSAFAQAGYTLPNMMSILTSLYPLSHGVLDAFKDKLPQRIRTLAEILKIHGYKTAWFANLSEPHLFTSVGFGRGYDDQFGLYRDLNTAGRIAEWVQQNRNERFFITVNSRHTHSPYFPLPRYKSRFSAGDKGDLPENPEVYLQLIYRDIVDQMERSDGLLYNVYDGSTKTAIKKMVPGSASGLRFWSETFDRIRLLTPNNKQYLLSRIRMQAYTSRVQFDNPENIAYITAMYDGCILGVDQELIKPLIKTLKENKIYDNTLIIFTADHGESLGEHGLVGHGLVYWDQVIHVPLIIKLPGKTKAARIQGLVQSIDILPTVLDYLNIEIPYQAQGNSLLPMMQNPSTKSPYQYVYGANRQAAYLRDHNWKLIAPRNGGNDTIDRLILYDMKSDPGENTNVVGSHPDLKAELLKRLTEHLTSLPNYANVQHDFPDDMDEETRERIKKTGYW